MSNIDDCGATRTVDGQSAVCIRPPGHDGVHLGDINYSGIVMPVQWSNTGDDPEPDVHGDEMPLWYSVLPLGEQVTIDFKDTLTCALKGELTGLVLDDHEQPAAITTREEADGEVVRRVVPWVNVNAISWFEGDQ